MLFMVLAQKIHYLKLWFKDLKLRILQNLCLARVFLNDLSIQLIKQLKREEKERNNYLQFELLYFKSSSLSKTSLSNLIKIVVL